jgi:hypothetical protein
MVSAVGMSKPNHEIFPYEATVTSVSTVCKNETKFMFEYQPADQLS